MFPQNGAPVKMDDHSRALLNISFVVPSKGALPPRPPHGVPSEKDAPFLEPPPPSFIMQSSRYTSPLSPFQIPLGR
jgi:hypothetical protein